MAVALAALVVASTGTAGAATGLLHGREIASHTIVHRNLASSSVTGRNVRDHSIAAKDLRHGVAVSGPKGDRGPAGATGATGPGGARGATGAAGPRGATGTAGGAATIEYHVSSNYGSAAGDRNAALGGAACDPGTYPVGGGVLTTDGRLGHDVVDASWPVVANPGSDPTTNPSGWAAYVSNTSTTDGDVTTFNVYVLCQKAPVVQSTTDDPLPASARSSAARTAATAVLRKEASR